MRFEDMRVLFLKQDEQTRYRIVAEYREARTRAIEEYMANKATKQRAPRVSKEKVTVTPEQREMMKKLGLKMNDLLRLKETV